MMDIPTTGCILSKPVVCRIGVIDEMKVNNTKQQRGAGYAEQAESPEPTGKHSLDQLLHLTV